MYIYIYICVCVLWVLLTLLRKKENALIIHSAMKTLKYAIIRLSEISFYLYALFRKFCTPLDLEPATPLYMEWLKQRNYMNFYRDQYFCFLDRDFDILNMTNYKIREMFINHIFGINLGIERLTHFWPKFNLCRNQVVGFY